jgi:hypothetical protein
MSQGPYLCAACGKLALPTNSNLHQGRFFVHRNCEPPPAESEEATRG